MNSVPKRAEEIAMLYKEGNATLDDVNEWEGLMLSAIPWGSRGLSWKECKLLEQEIKEAAKDAREQVMFGNL